MEITTFRLVKRIHFDSAFNGEGARLYGGRWNSPGVPVVYTSESLALCCLEIFVHLPSYKLLNDYVYFKLSFDSELVTNAEISDGWSVRPVSKVSQSIGDKWILDNNFPVLKVPSVIIPEGANYLLNTGHSDIQRIKIGKPSPMVFDPRLQK